MLFRICIAAASLLICGFVVNSFTRPAEPDSTNYPTMKQCGNCGSWYAVGGRCPNGH